MLFFRCSKVGGLCWRLVWPLGALFMGDTAGIALWAHINTSFKVSNRRFNMYTETSNRQECFSSKKNFHPKCFETTVFDGFHRLGGGVVVPLGKFRESFNYTTFPLCFHLNF